jgi:hypothetical protein
MPDEILSREEIARQADQAAQRSVAKDRCEPNPFTPNTDAWRQWKVDFERYLVLHSAPESESSA